MKRKIIIIIRLRETNNLQIDKNKKARTFYKIRRQKVDEKTNYLLISELKINLDNLYGALKTFGRIRGLQKGTKYMVKRCYSISTAVTINKGFNIRRW